MRRLALIAALAGTLPAQQTDAVFRVDTELLQIEVRVLDKQGRPIVGIDREAFTLRERGAAQEIATFEFIEQPAAAAQSSADAPIDTYLYLLSDSSPENTTFAYRAMRDFLAEQWQSGYSVAMPGLPFTNDPQRAQRFLDALQRGEGPSWRRSLWDDFGASDRTTREFFDQLRENAGLNDEETPSALAEIIQSSRAGFENNLFYAGIQTTRYRDVVKQLGLQPGKKVIVLFRDGLNIEKDMIPSYRDLASEALRYRVAFYTVDTRGLVPNDNMRIEGAFAASRTPNRRLPGTYGRIEGLRSLTEGGELSDDDGRNGMRTLAELTGGRAVVNTNDFGEVFERVDADRKGYYVLGYYPEPSDERGRFRKIRVDVDGPGLKVETTDGYFERQEFQDWSQSDRHNHLYHALNASEPFNDLPFWVRYDVFRGRAGGAEAILTVGVPPSALSVKPNPDDETRELASFVMMARLGGVEPDREPLYGGSSLALNPPAGSFAQLAADPLTRFELTKSFPIASPQETLRVLLRDELSGRIGAQTVQLRAPDFDKPWAPSSVLLTARVQEADPKNPSVLDVGTVRLVPQSQTVFAKGKEVFILYDLYNVEEDLVSTLPGFMVFLKKGAESVTARFEGEASFDSKAGTIRYAGALETADLDPGVYQVLVPAPEGAKNPKRYLARSFRVR